MCGIAGWFRPAGHVDAGIVLDMTNALAHRGPDDAAIESLDGGRLAFGFRRLAILDLSSRGRQPMSDASGRVWIVFNGEIYNFREIRAELESRGFAFRSGSDTEVILAGYKLWGTAVVDRFRGMFAFALWDQDERRLILCRDRFGVKPLYYAVRPDGLYFASELKGLIAASATSRSVDAVALAEFLRHGYVSAPRTIFSDVSVVPPGHLVEFDASLRVSTRCYWSTQLLYRQEEVHALREELARLDESAVIDRVEDSLTEAFGLRMVSDVPVGVFLSGGIDSSLVAALLTRRCGHRLRTFTIGFDSPEFDESAHAATVSRLLGTEHVVQRVTGDDALALSRKLPDIFDEPSGDSSAIPTLMVAQLARAHVKVALSADGADELFAGYARYDICGRFTDALDGYGRHLYLLSAEALAMLPPHVLARAYAASRRGGQRFAAVADKIRKFIRMARARDAFGAYDAAVSEWDAASVSRLSLMQADAFAAPSAAFHSVTTDEPRERMMHFDTARYLTGDLLTKVDRTSMAVSLEAREPCLDHIAAKLAVALPMHWKLRGRTGKYILRRILARHLPAEIFERPKQGFSAPIDRWLRGALLEPLRASLAPSRVRAAGLLDADAASGMLRRYLAGGREITAAGMWHLLQLQQWAERWKVAAVEQGAEPVPAQATRHSRLAS